MKYFNFKRYKFTALLKNVSQKIYSFSKVYKYLNFERYNFSNIYKYFKFERYNFNKIYRYLSFKRYDFAKIIGLFRIKQLTSKFAYLLTFVAFISFSYLSIPFFYNYNKLNIKKLLCEEININCIIEGKIKYSFFPSPRIKLKNLLIKDFNNKDTIGEIEKVDITIPLLKLLDKEKFEFNKIFLEKGKINLDFEESDYKKYLTKSFGTKPIYLKKSTINFFDNDNYIASIRNVNFKFKPKKKSEKLVLTGNFLNDEIIIKLNSNKKKNTPSKILSIKMKESNIFLKADIVNTSNKGDFKGNLLFKKNKNSLTSQLIYENNKLNFLKANLRNPFLDGKFNGTIEFLPFFNFDLDFNLNGLNFTKFYNFFVSLDKKKVFQINKKINGKISLSSNKLYSKYNLVDSFESRIKFVNGDVIIEQMLLNMGKLGAADITGTIENNKKFTNLKFEKNIFIDNLKAFYNKFGIYNKEKKSTSLYVDGNLNLIDLNLRILEISNEEKIKEDDVSYIEREFNEIVLEEGYISLFDFTRIKDFVKTVTTETN